MEKKYQAHESRLCVVKTSVLPHGCTDTVGPASLRPLASHAGCCAVRFVNMETDGTQAPVDVK
jgi:hypothetical protein